MLLDDLDGAVTALEHGSVDVVPEDMSIVCLALLAGVQHLRECATTRRWPSPPTSSNGRAPTSKWLVGLSAVHVAALRPRAGPSGPHAEALDFLRDLLEDNAVPATPGVMTSVVVVLAALAAGGVIATSPGSRSTTPGAIMTSGVRTPVDVALYSEYLGRYGQAGDGAGGEIAPGPPPCRCPTPVPRPQGLGHQHNDAKYSGVEPAT